MPPPCSWRASYREPSSSRTATATASGRRVRTTQPSPVRCAPRTACGSCDQPSTTARRSSPLTSRDPARGTEWPVASAGVGRGPRVARLGDRGRRHHRPAVGVRRAVFAARLLGGRCLLGRRGLLRRRPSSRRAPSWRRGPSSRRGPSCAPLAASSPAGRVHDRLVPAAASPLRSSPPRRAGVVLVGARPRSPRSSVVIVSPSSGCSVVARSRGGRSVAAGQPGEGVQRDHQPVRAVACLVDALVNRLVGLERPKEW